MHTNEFICLSNSLTAEECITKVQYKQGLQENQLKLIKYIVLITIIN